MGPVLLIWGAIISIVFSIVGFFAYAVVEAGGASEINVSFIAFSAAIGWLWAAIVCLIAFALGEKLYRQTQWTERHSVTIEVGHVVNADALRKCTKKRRKKDPTTCM